MSQPSHVVSGKSHLGILMMLAWPGYSGTAASNPSPLCRYRDGRLAGSQRHRRGCHQCLSNLANQQHPERHRCWLLRSGCPLDRCKGQAGYRAHCASGAAGSAVHGHLHHAHLPVNCAAFAQVDGCAAGCPAGCRALPPNLCAFPAVPVRLLHLLCRSAVHGRYQDPTDSQHGCQPAQRRAQLLPDFPNSTHRAVWNVLHRPGCRMGRCRRCDCDHHLHRHHRSGHLLYCPVPQAGLPHLAARQL